MNRWLPITFSSLIFQLQKCGANGAAGDPAPNRVVEECSTEPELVSLRWFMDMELEAISVSDPAVLKDPVISSAVQVKVWNTSFITI